MTLRMDIRDKTGSPVLIFESDLTPKGKLPKSFSEHLVMAMEAGNTVTIYVANQQERPKLPVVQSNTAYTVEFDTWWNSIGKYIDPDTEDVPWFDKRSQLCYEAYVAGHREGWKERGKRV